MPAKPLSRGTKGALLALLCFQLGFVALGITDAKMPEKTPAWVTNFYFVYERLTAAGASYGFFSPDIGQQLVVHFELREGGGARHRISLEQLLTHEVAIRYGNIVRFFVESYENERLRRSVAASLAARIFARFPKAEEVAMVASAYRFPSLQEYREGRRPETREIYRVTFQPKARHE